MVEAQRKLFTVDEFHRMGRAGIFSDDVRLELLGGEIFEMPPIGPAHAGGVGFLTHALVTALGGRALVWVQNPIVIDDHSEPIPDVVLLRPRDDFYRNAHPRPGDVLLLIEVADSSARGDRADKLPRYAATGIPEVWIVDLSRRRVEICREPSGGEYQTVAILGPEESVSPGVFPDVQIAVNDILS